MTRTTYIPGLRSVRVAWPWQGEPARFERPGGAKFCASCGSRTYSTNPRTTESGDIYRRRDCPKCGAHHETLEIAITRVTRNTKETA